MENKEVIVNMDKSKLKKRMMQFALIGLVSLGAIVFLLSGSTIYIFYLIMSMLIFAVSVFITFKMMFDVFSSKEKMGLKVNEKGVLFLGTSAGKKAGKVLWKDIKSISNQTFYNVEGYVLDLRNPEKYIQPDKKSSILTNGIFVSNSDLEISHNDLKKLLNDYYQEFGGVE